MAGFVLCIIIDAVYCDSLSIGDACTYPIVKY